MPGFSLALASGGEAAVSVGEIVSEEAVVSAMGDACLRKTAISAAALNAADIALL